MHNLKRGLADEVLIASTILAPAIGTGFDEVTGRMRRRGHLGLWGLLDHGVYVGTHRRFQFLQQVLNRTFCLLRKWREVLPLLPVAQPSCQSGFE